MRKTKKIDIPEKKEEKKFSERRPGAEQSGLDEFILRDVQEFSRLGIGEEIDFYRRQQAWR